MDGKPREIDDVVDFSQVDQMKLPWKCVTCIEFQQAITLMFLAKIKSVIKQMETIVWREDRSEIGRGYRLSSKAQSSTILVDGVHYVYLEIAS